MSEQDATHVVLDVSHLPKVAFGHRAMSSWALMGFIAVEGTTLAVVLASYFYLRLNASEWPPSASAEPDLLIPLVNLTLIMVCIWPARRLN